MATMSIPEENPPPSWRKDIRSILLLFGLYILQGIPLGLILTVPFLLQSKGVHYQDQAKFSLAFWPFSLKVLYAPVIDAIYWKRLGRRKSWLIPLQYLIAIFLFVLAFNIEDLFASRNVSAITAMFFMLNFLAASQDVAVDGWALTMLSPENVGYASTCNAVGQTLGFVFGYSGFLALDSANFANKFRSTPQEYGLVSFPQFLLFCAVVFAITTTLVLIFKKEKKETAEVSEQHMDICASYMNLYRILKLKNIQVFILFLLTVRIGTAATDAMTRLKLVEKGIPKETLAFFSIPLIPLKLLLPIITSRWTVGPNPMHLFINTIPFALLFGIIHPLVIFWLPEFKNDEGEYSYGVYFFIFGVFAIELLPNYTRFVTGMGFAAKISDPAIGGTYMTLINTITNVGGTWPTTLALWLVEYVGITIKECYNSITSMYSTTLSPIYALNSSLPDIFDLDDTENVTRAYEDFAYNISSNFVKEPPCESKIDGYYIESIFCVAVGFLWLFWGRPTILRLSRKPASAWRVI